MREVVIAGGGLAGLALGVALRGQQLPVRVCEATSYPRHRVCGEFISGIAVEELEALGIADLLAPAPRHRDTAWYDEGALLLTRRLPEAAYGLSRHTLDTALAERFQSMGGRLQLGVRQTEDAEGIVWASGRMKGASPWMGLKAHFSGLSLRADLEIHLARSAYVGLTRIENDLVNVSGLFRRDRPATAGDEASPLHAAVREAGLETLADRLGLAELLPSSLKGVNQFALGWQTRRPGAVCIGDAAAMIPPFTGNGMTMAFQGALMAVQPLVQWSRGECSWEATAHSIRSAQRERFSTRLRWARLLQSLLMHRAARQIIIQLLRHGLLPFDQLYHKLR
jgi:menaquinone-9 beta-reductase